jgi:hypothetical protein
LSTRVFENCCAGAQPSDPLIIVSNLYCLGFPAMVLPIHGAALQLQLAVRANQKLGWPLITPLMTLSGQKKSGLSEQIVVLRWSRQLV